MANLSTGCDFSSGGGGGGWGLNVLVFFNFFFFEITWRNTAQAEF